MLPLSLAGPASAVDWRRGSGTGRLPRPPPLPGVDALRVAAVPLPPLTLEYIDELQELRKITNIG